MIGEVESRLRSWAGNLRNGAYRKYALEAADKIKGLEAEVALLRGAMAADERRLQAAEACAAKLESVSKDGSLDGSKSLLAAWQKERGK